MTQHWPNNSSPQHNQESEDLLTRGLREFSERLTKKNEELREKPSDWIQKHFYVPEPRDPLTGEILPPGPIRLAEHQARIIDEMLSRQENGLLRYSTCIYSAPKKSGKSALSSAVGLYFAYHNPNSYIACLANDKKQSEDRLYTPIYECIRLHNQMGGIFHATRAYNTEVKLENHTKIEAVPCDAAGEAGAEPLLTLWSELWGFETELKRRLWTEMTIPPTKFGRACRWVESYAGFSGSSELLWQLYESNIKEEYRHPDFPDLPVYRNGLVAAYWDTQPRMIWQTPEYYTDQAKSLTPSEFQRVHRNQWVSPMGAFIQPGQWEACADESIPELTDPDVPLVVGIDAAVENDCSAIVGVTRHHMYPDTDVSVRLCRIFSPKEGGSILIPIEKTLREWGHLYNIVLVTYDIFQLASTIQNLQQGNISITEDEIRGMSPEQVEMYLKGERKAVLRWYEKFGQQSDRAVADKRLFDLISHKNLHYNPAHPGMSDLGSGESLSKHIRQAGVSRTKGQFRIQKLTQANKIDAVIALSMAADRCMTLNITNRESDQTSLIKQLVSEKISYSQFMAAMRNRNTKIT